MVLQMTYLNFSNHAICIDSFKNATFALAKLSGTGFTRLFIYILPNNYWALYIDLFKVFLVGTTLKLPCNIPESFSEVNFLFVLYAVYKTWSTMVIKFHSFKNELCIILSYNAWVQALFVKIKVHPAASVIISLQGELLLKKRVSLTLSMISVFPKFFFYLFIFRRCMHTSVQYTIVLCQS